MLKKEIHIIVNPFAGAGKAAKILPDLKSAIKEKTDSTIQIHLTQKPHDATELTRRLISSGAELIVAAGGDGTVNEVVNGFAGGNGIFSTTCELGIIKCGTGMGTALSLLIPDLLTDQVDLILGPTTSTVDIGKIAFTGFDDQPHERYFISESQLGIGSAIADQVHKGYNFLNGKLAFGIVSLKQSLVFKPQHLRITVDEKTVYTDTFIGIAVGNGSQTAGGMHLTPDAKLNDGLFDILFIHRMGILDRMINFPKIYSGNHIYSRWFTYIKGKTIEIVNDKFFTVSADGELLGKTPCLITLLPAALKVKSSYSLSTFI